jgi:nicotinamidase/pyrazinamidase
MLDGPLIFVDIDTQRDFLEPTGALYIARSEAILPNLARLTAFAREHGIPVLATACAHTLDQADPEPFPPHCLVGTHGQTRSDATAWPSSRILHPGGSGPDEVVPHLTIEKTTYDLFSHRDAERIVELYGQDRPTFVVYGVATDYCVRVAVHGLLTRAHRVAIVVDAIRAVDPSTEADLLTDFARRGALLTLTDVVCAAG